MSHCDNYQDDLLALFVLINHKKRKERKWPTVRMKSRLFKRDTFTHTNLVAKIRAYLEYNFPKTFKRQLIFNKVYYRIFLPRSHGFRSRLGYKKKKLHSTRQMCEGKKYIAAVD